MNKIILSFLLAGGLALWSAPLGAVEIVGHRGAAFVAPENTVVSMKKAWEMDVDAGECDVFISSDRRIMVNHDETTLRTSGVDLIIAKTSSDELRKLDVGAWKGLQFKGEKMPFLEEILETIPAGKVLFVEFKAGVEILPTLQEVVEKSGKIDQLKFISFDFDTICRAKKMMPNVPAYYLLETEEDPKTHAYPPFDVAVLKKVKENNLQGVDVYHKSLNETFVKAVHDMGMQIYVWTVDRPLDAFRMKKLGVDGITTNRPDTIRRTVFLGE